MREFLERLGKSNVLVPNSQVEDYITWAKLAGLEYREALLNQYVPNGVQVLTPNKVLRASSMGKFVFDLAFEYFYPDKAKELELSERQASLFFDGHAFESWLGFALRRLGYRITGRECTIEWQGITGHVDFIVDDAWVVEAKCVSDRFFKFLSGYDGVLRGDSVNEWLQDRGYLTQLSIYCDATGLPGMLVFKNKNTGDVGALELTKEMSTNRLLCAAKTLNVIRSSQTFIEVFDHVEIPPPEIEIYKKKVSRWADGTPRLYPHYAIKYPGIIYHLHQGETYYGNTRQYVLGYRYPPDCINTKLLNADFQGV